MIQTALSFVLGFLCAAFLAVLVAPAIWRRAVALTRRRVEASLPLSVDQIQADKDSLRAEFAVSARKLEMSVKSLKDKAAGQLVELGRLREELALAKEESGKKSGAIAGLEARVAELEAGSRAKEEELRLAGEALAGQGKLAEERALEIEKLGRMYDEASFSASSRQIEIAAHEAKLEGLTADLSTLRGEHKQAAARAKEESAENKTLRETLRAREKELRAVSEKLAETEKLSDERAAELERLGGLYEEAKFVASSSQVEMAARDAKLTRLASDVAALRDERKQADVRLRETGSENKTLREALRAEQKKAAALEKKVDRLIASVAEGEEKLERRERELGRLREQHRNGTAPEQAVAGADQARLQERLELLTRENRKLREAQRSGGGKADAEGEALLRAQIGDLAAEVVHLTALLGGPGSELSKTLASSSPPVGEGGPSLAERIRALQDAASTR